MKPAKGGRVVNALRTIRRSLRHVQEGDVVRDLSVPIGGPPKVYEYLCKAAYLLEGRARVLALEGECSVCKARYVFTSGVYSKGLPRTCLDHRPIRVEGRDEATQTEE